MPNGQLCMIGDGKGNLSRLFYYGITAGLHVEIIDRRTRGMKHLMQLVDPSGQPVSIPPGSYFKHVSSGEEAKLLENRLRDLSRTLHVKEGIPA